MRTYHGQVKIATQLLERLEYQRNQSLKNNPPHGLSFGLQISVEESDLIQDCILVGMGVLTVEVLLKKFSGDKKWSF